MSVELRPYGYACKNKKCNYCYQQDNFPIKEEPNWDEYKRKVKKATEERDDRLLLFGGDAGAYPEEKLKEIIKWGDKELDNPISIQTGGWWIDSDWIDWLSKYNVHVGLSIDGPWPLNEFRPFKDEEKTKEYTERLMNLMPRMKEELSVGIITTLSKANASPERYPKFKEWLKGLPVGGRIHFLQPKGDTAISSIRLKGVLIDLAQFEEQIDHNWTPFSDIKSMLEGGSGSCIWGECDPFNTQADYAIDPGGITVCSRNFAQGLRPLRAPEKSDMRSEVLKNTPREDNGCQDCPFWDYCHGFCPGMAKDNDWRNNSIYCEHIRALLSYYKGNKAIKNEDTENNNTCTSENVTHGDQSHGDWGDHGDSYSEGRE